MGKDGRKNVFIALKMSGISGREKLSGIYRYLTERYGDASAWSIRLIRNRNELSRKTIEEAIAAGFDGFIISIPGTERATAPLGGVNIPSVITDIRSPEIEQRPHNLVIIRSSSESIGQLAAETLAAGSYRAFAFLHPRAPTDWSIDRCQAFSTALAEHGIWCNELKELTGIVDLPRPCAVLAANDDLALETMNYLQSRGIAVPDAVAILGVDNDTLLCEHSSPRLTSVEPDFEKIGYLAAKELDRTMTDPGGPAMRISVPARNVVIRDSLRIESDAARLVQKALTFIEQHATEGIAVPDVVAHLGCSRRLADLRFREVHGCTILEKITERRLDAVKTRLTLSRAKIETISTECGYRDPCYLKTLFKKRFGCTMTEWRNLH